MTRIVSQLLDIAELETYSIDPREKADLRAICAEVAEFAAPLALAQGKSIALSGDGRLGMDQWQLGDGPVHALSAISSRMRSTIRRRERPSRSSSRTAALSASWTKGPELGMTSAI